MFGFDDFMFKTLLYLSRVLRIQYRRNALLQSWACLQLPRLARSRGLTTQKPLKHQTLIAVPLLLPQRHQRKQRQRRKPRQSRQEKARQRVGSSGLQQRKVNQRPRKTLRNHRLRKRMLRNQGVSSRRRKGQRLQIRNQAQVLGRRLLLRRRKSRPRRKRSRQARRSRSRTRKAKRRQSRIPRRSWTESVV